jgi:hypothetical protein
MDAMNEVGRIVSAEAVDGAGTGTPIYDALLAEWKKERRHAPDTAAAGGLGRPRRSVQPPKFVPVRRAAS